MSIRLPETIARSVIRSLIRSNFSKRSCSAALSNIRSCPAALNSNKIHNFTTNLKKANSKTSIRSFSGAVSELSLQNPSAYVYSRLHPVDEMPERVRTEAIEKPLEDHRKYRFLELKNGLQCLLVSDSKCDKASACLAVRIGSLFDLKEIPGLAHFLEHMLFLGTKKYPKEDSYNEYLAKNGGSSNAYTSGTQTVYYFDVKKEALFGDDSGGALDRFAQFFLPNSPLFSESATERELNAVHSEHTKNIQSDSWRMNQLLRSQCNPEHPLCRFATGNYETLKTVPERDGTDLRKELLNFHQKYYSSNVMTMSILGEEDLDTLEKRVTEQFSGVENKNVYIPIGKEISTDPKTGNIIPAFTSVKKESSLGSSPLGTYQKVIPVKDQKSVTFHFLIPEQRLNWESQPTKYLSHLLGHEGKGSIYEILKKRNLATELCSGTAFDEAGICLFSIDIHLTEKGQNNIQEVGEVVFKYIGMLKKEISKGINDDSTHNNSTMLEKVYNELSKIDRMGFKFRSLSDPTSAVVSLATGLQDLEIPPEKVMSAHSIIWKFNPNLVKETIEFLIPSNSQIIQVGKEILRESSEYIEQEYYYGTKHTKPIPMNPIWKESWDILLSKDSFTLKKDSDSTMLSTKYYEKAKNLEEELILFKENPFIAENLDFKPLEGKETEYPIHYSLNSNNYDSTSKSGNSNTTSSNDVITISSNTTIENLSDNNYSNGTSMKNDLLSIHLWHKQDSLFKLPKAVLAFSIYSPWTSLSPRNMLCTEMWSQIVAEELNDYAYDAEIAGVSYKMAADSRGLNLELGGYNDKLHILMDKVVEKIINLGSSNDPIKQSTFDLVYERIRRDILNASEKRQPYSQAMTLNRRMNTKNALGYDEKLKIFETIRLNDLNNIQLKIFSKLKSEDINNLFHSSKKLGSLYNQYDYHTNHNIDDMKINHIDDYKNNYLLNYLKRDVHIEGLVMGNITRKETNDLVEKQFRNKIISKLNNNNTVTTTSNNNNTVTTSNNNSTVEPVSSLFLRDDISLYLRKKGSNIDESNGSALIALQIGKTNVKLWMMTSLYSQIIGQKFFDELRTKQQLGYIVAHQATKTTTKIELLYLVQSEIPTWECIKRIEQFITNIRETYFNENKKDIIKNDKVVVDASSIITSNLKNDHHTVSTSSSSSTNMMNNSDHTTTVFDEFTFNEYRNALIMKLEEKPKKLSDEFLRNYQEVKDRTNDFDRRRRSIEFLKNLKYDEFLKFSQSITLDNCPQMRIEVIPSTQWKNKPKINEIIENYLNIVNNKKIGNGMIEKKLITFQEEDDQEDGTTSTTTSTTRSKNLVEQLDNWLNNNVGKIKDGAPAEWLDSYNEIKEPLICSEITCSEICSEDINIKDINKKGSSECKGGDEFKVEISKL